MNNFLLIIAGILVLLLTALFAVPPMINWNDFRGAFEEEASRLLDREVRVRGEVSVRLLPAPYVSFEKVRIADAPGVPGSFARADQFKMWLAVPPLLRGVFEARQIELERPVIRLRTEADGSGNWKKLRISESSLAFFPKEVALNSVQINQGTVLFESHLGHEISKLSEISGEMTAAALSGPFKFNGSIALGDEAQQVRLSTARMDNNGQVRFKGTLRRADNSSAHTINGTLFDLLGSARAEGKFISRIRAAKGSTDRPRQAGYEMTADVRLDARALTLKKIAIAFQDKDRQQTLNGSATTSWTEGVVTETRLAARWLDLDAIAGTKAGEGPLRAVERLLTRGIEPLGAGVTSVEVAIDQANLAGTAISDFTGRMVRRDGVTKIEALRASLPGQSAIALDGFLERRETGLQFDGNLLVRSSSFAELVQWARADLDIKSRRALSASFSLHGNIRVRPKHFELSEARMRLAGATAEGGFSYNWSSNRPALIANIDADKIALERFGKNFLAPRQIAHFVGLRSASDPDDALHKLQRDTDIALQLRANQLSDGVRIFSNIDVDVGRNGDALTLSKFNATWNPGLKLTLAGKLKGLTKRPRGNLTGTIAATTTKAGRHLIHLLGLAADRSLPDKVLDSRTPLRVSLNAELGEAVDQSPAGLPTNRIVVDGLIGQHHLRVNAQSFGALDQWMKAPAHVQARISGNEVLAATRWLTGRPLGEAVAGTRPEFKQKRTNPATIVMTASGVPERSMKTFLRIIGGRTLNAEYSGDLSLAGETHIESAWSGIVDVKRSTAKSLADLVWPSLWAHLDNVPVKGRFAVASSKTGYTLQPQNVRVGNVRLDGSVELVTGQAEAPSKIKGSISLSDASAPDLANLLMRAQRVSKPEAEQEPAGRWPDTPFGFGHLAGAETDLNVKIDRLQLDDRGTRLSNASFRVTTSKSLVSIEKFTARRRGGTYQGMALLEKSQAGVSVKAHISGSGLKLGDWAPAIADAERLGGTAKFDLSVAGQALSPRSLATVLSGSGKVRLSNVNLPGLTTRPVTEAAQAVINGDIDVDALAERLSELAVQSTIKLGSPKLNVRIADGTVTFPTILFEQAEGGLRNATVIDLPQWRIDSQWTVTPAPQPRAGNPEERVALPSISIVYNGSISDLGKVEPKINLGDLERELIVRKMEANVARLERLRREDEERAAAERERQQRIEEEQRRSIEAEQLRRQQTQRGTRLPETVGQRTRQQPPIVPPRPILTQPPAVQ